MKAIIWIISIWYFWNFRNISFTKAFASFIFRNIIAWKHYEFHCFHDRSTWKSKTWCSWEERILERLLNLLFKYKCAHYRQIKVLLGYSWKRSYQAPVTIRQKFSLLPNFNFSSDRLLTSVKHLGDFHFLMTDIRSLSYIFHFLVAINYSERP